MIFMAKVCACMSVCVRVHVCACVLGGGRLAVVFHPGDGGFAEETVFVVHQVLVDAGSARQNEKTLFKLY